MTIVVSCYYLFIHSHWIFSKTLHHFNAQSIIAIPTQHLMNICAYNNDV